MDKFKIRYIFELWIYYINYIFSKILNCYLIFIYEKKNLLSINLGCVLFRLGTWKIIRLKNKVLN